MKNTDFDFKRISEGYKNRPFLHKQIIQNFHNEIGKPPFLAGLDIGCGAGLSTKALKTICTKVTGIDISTEMVCAAKELCRQDENIDCIVSSAEDLLIEERNIDIVTAAGAIQWIDRDSFLSNLKHMMKENGYLLIYDFAISDQMKENPAYTDWWHTQYIKEFPKPYRDESVWENKDVADYGFHIINQIDLEMEYSFSLESFIEFMMIQSNVNAKIDGGVQNEDAVYRWFENTLSPVFHGQNQCLLFKGYRWCFQYQNLNHLI